MSNDDFGQRFGDRLRQLRLERGLTQEQLALDAGLHRTHVSLIERNQREIRLTTLKVLAIALDVEPSALIPSSPRTAIRGPSKVRGGSHPDMAHLHRLFPYVREYQGLATKHGISDVFQDNGGKILQTLLILNLRATGRREGNDAFDEEGNEYELKTVNLDLTRSFSTHHHLNPTILGKYRAVKCWFFSIYRGIELVEIYRVMPARLEAEFFQKWEAKWHANGGKDINNPKIPVSYVKRHGDLVYADEVDDSL